MSDTDADTSREPRRRRYARGVARRGSGVAEGRGDRAGTLDRREIGRRGETTSPGNGGLLGPAS